MIDIFAVEKVVKKYFSADKTWYEVRDGKLIIKIEVMDFVYDHQLYGWADSQMRTDLCALLAFEDCSVIDIEIVRGRPKGK